MATLIDSGVLIAIARGLLGIGGDLARYGENGLLSPVARFLALRTMRVDSDGAKLVAQSRSE